MQLQDSNKDGFKKGANHQSITQLTFTYSKSTTETTEKGVTYVQSQQ